jgi:hypothetical protein
MRLEDEDRDHEKQDNATDGQGGKLPDFECEVCVAEREHGTIRRNVEAFTSDR